MHRIALALVLSLVAGCGSQTLDSESTVPPENDVVELPPAVSTGAMSLEQALTARRSVRDFASETLGIEETSQLLWAAQGVTSASGNRTAPSAGALYPLELYVADATGVHHYLPDGHRLQRVAAGDVRPAIMDAALGQAPIGDAPSVFVITAVQARTEAKYGSRAERYVKLEAGHAAQNLLLQAVALDLGAVPVGAFGDLEVRRVLDLPDGEEPLYLIAVGHPLEGGR
jgi:SagB-type dehydrogenase family enzyme